MPKKDTDDVALVWGATRDGEMLGVLRKRGDSIEPALVRKAREGEPIHGELVRLTPREEPLLYDVDVVYDGRRGTQADRSGPPQVASEQYRKGWDRLFKARASKSKSDNRALN